MNRTVFVVLSDSDDTAVQNALLSFLKQEQAVEAVLSMKTGFGDSRDWSRTPHHEPVMNSKPFFVGDEVLSFLDEQQNVSQEKLFEKVVWFLSMAFSREIPLNQNSCIIVPQKLGHNIPAVLAAIALLASRARLSLSLIVVSALRSTENPFSSVKPFCLSPYLIQSACTAIGAPWLLLAHYENSSIEFGEADRDLVKRNLSNSLSVPLSRTILVPQLSRLEM